MQITKSCLTMIYTDEIIYRNWEILIQNMKIVSFAGTGASKRDNFHVFWRYCLHSCLFLLMSILPLRREHTVFETFLRGALFREITQCFSYAITEITNDKPSSWKITKEKVVWLLYFTVCFIWMQYIVFVKCLWILGEMSTDCMAITYTADYNSLVAHPPGHHNSG